MHVKSQYIKSCNMDIKIEFKAKILTMTKNINYDLFYIDKRQTLLDTNKAMLNMGGIRIKGRSCLSQWTLNFLFKLWGRHVATQSTKGTGMILWSSCSHPRALALLPKLPTPHKAIYIPTS